MNPIRKLIPRPKPQLTVIRRETTTVWPDGYEGKREVPKLNVPKFGYDRKESKTRHIGLAQSVEDVSLFRRW